MPTTTVAVCGVVVCSLAAFFGAPKGGQMTAAPTESHDAPDATGRRSPLNDDPIVLLLYGEEHVNLALADELELDGYEVRRASDTAKLRAVCSACEVELVIFGRAGLERKAARGGWCGGRRPYGYDIPADRDHLERNPTEAPLVPVIFDHYVNRQLGSSATAK